MSGEDNLLLGWIQSIISIEMNLKTTFDNGSLGSRNDEERSELR